jgi:hypothetical protein
MRMAKKLEIKKFLDRLAAPHMVNPAFTLPLEAIDAYAEELADVDADVLFDAVKPLRRGCRFFPSIREIFEVCQPRMDERARRQALRENAGLVAETYDQNDPRILECRMRLRDICRRSSQWPAG